ncbi:MAG: DUF4173 domain-containing protein [Alphaproteobacteria bacterium]|nr:MAG: DUF4173 domain-containing protein [Alphaproteobacteria bacterium]
MTHALAVRSVSLKFILCVFTIVLADFLFFRQPAGWTAGLFAATVLLLTLSAHLQIMRTPGGKPLLFLTALLLPAMIYQPGFLPVLMFLLGIGSLLIIAKRGGIRDAVSWLRDLRYMGLRFLTRWYRDSRVLAAIRRKRGTRLWQGISYCLMPAVFTIAFLWLFTKANPVFSAFFDHLNLRLSLLSQPLGRWIFWGLTGSAVWSLLRPKLPKIKPLSFAQKAGEGSRIESIDENKWVTPRSLLVSLIIFNALFALQNGSDIAYLWQGIKLPDGMSYAQYAHAGAYPLIVTAVLAAGYILMCFKDTKRTVNFNAAEKLVMLWIAQNIFLVFSAINRLLQYIDAYSLTSLRIAALVWMVLVAIGLALITIRVFFSKRNIWLVNMNVIVLLAVLYGSCFVNFDRIVAQYNVHHAREITGNTEKSYFDFYYMNRLGAESIAALEWFQYNANLTPDNRRLLQDNLAYQRTRLQNDVQNWRSWTLQKHLLAQKHGLIDSAY